jgi:hypothetical protein
MRQAYEEAANAIEAFVDNRGGPLDWDDFTSGKERDSYLEAVRIRCCTMPDEYPTKQKGHYCSDEGMQVLRALAAEVRAKIPSLPDEERA